MMSQENSISGAPAFGVTPPQSSLDKVRVLDMARVLAGPWAAQLLADFGAEVIKLEHPVRGDDSRSWEPSFCSSNRPDLRQSAYFCAVNRGKKSVSVDFSRPEGAELVRELAMSSDVLIENYKVGTLSRYGLSYEELSARHPGLIYCSITGFGQTGPYRSRAGYDTIIQAMGGLMSLTGHADGDPGGGPMRTGLPVIDLLTGLYAALAITAALRHRASTGKGQYIDLGLLDVHVSALAFFGLNYLATGVLPQRTGNSNPVTFPSGAFASKDKEIVILVGNDQQFKRFCSTLGQPQWNDDNRFKTLPSRVEHSKPLRALIEPVIAMRDSSYWIKELEKIGVPCAPINNLREVFENEQVAAREAVRTLKHPLFGDIPSLASPIRMSETPMSYGLPPPTLGQDTCDVLADLLGKSESDIAALRDAGII